MVPERCRGLRAAFLNCCSHTVMQVWRNQVYSAAAFQLASTDVWFCSWLSSQLHNGADSEWIFGPSFGVARHAQHLLTYHVLAASVYAVTTEVASDFHIFHFELYSPLVDGHCLDTSVKFHILHVAEFALSHFIAPQRVIPRYFDPPQPNKKCYNQCTVTIFSCTLQGQILEVNSLYPQNCGNSMKLM